MGGFFGPSGKASSGSGLPPTPSVDSVLVNGPDFGNAATWLPLSDFQLRGSALQFQGTAQSVLAAGSYSNFTPGTSVDLINQLQIQSSGPAGDITLTGLVAPAGIAPFGPGGEPILLQNVDSAHNLILSIQDASSTAANRFVAATASVILPPGTSQWLFYDSVAHRWQVVS